MSSVYQVQLQWVLTHLCVAAGLESQGDIREWPAEFIRPKQTKIWTCERGPCTSWAYEEKMTLFLEIHNSVCPRYCQELDLTRERPPGVRRPGLVDLMRRRCQSGQGKVGEWPLRQSHTTRSVPYSVIFFIKLIKFTILYVGFIFLSSNLMM